MRILILTKRQYMNKDLLDDQYGRFYELAQELAKRGHQITGLCLSYRPRKDGHLSGPELDGTFVDWYSVSLGRLIILGMIRYQKKINILLKRLKPEIIFTCSDAPHVIYGSRIARKHNIYCVADLYDNFESYASTRLPGILLLFKQAVKNVHGIACVSNALKCYIEEQYNPQGIIRVLSNGVPTAHFYPLDRQECRKKFGLPVNAKLIGTAGALGASRGIEVLFKAANALTAKDPSIHLVVAGQLESDMVLPKGKNIHYLGKLVYNQVPILFNALDVGIICNRESSFGRYCFPQKAYEMMACGLPVVAADVGAMSEIFIDHPEHLYAPGNHHALVQSIRKQLACSATLPCIEILTWADLAKKMESFLLDIVS
jgi:teichuronic acid biosynthesis glycosyltransferase TuaC